MNPVLTRANNHIREQSESKQVQPCVVWQRGEFLHIALRSQGCVFRKAGSCVMCDYGFGDSLSAEEVVVCLKKSIHHAHKPISELLIGTCGSILDKSEISRDVLDSILEYVASLNIRTLILETHYSTVDEQILNEVKERLCGTSIEIVIELGLESANPFVLENSLNKDIDLSSFEQVVSLIKDKDMGVVVNVLLGVPFLTPYQQLQDTLQAIEYALNVGANRVDVFPINIKPHTFLGLLYQKKIYSPISSWMIVELLRSLPTKHLDKIEFSWFGDRQRNRTATNAIPPCSCANCDSILFEFINKFLNSFELQYRRNLMCDFFNQDLKSMCGCYNAVISSLSDTRSINPEFVINQHKTLNEEIAK